MGSKIAAKELMREAGVPVLERGSRPADRRTEADLPLLVKASAGGGGRGMRVVRDLADLRRRDRRRPRPRRRRPSATAPSSSSRTSSAGRHVEVQVVGDTHGDVLVLGERDCSIQRRHQKVVEESPAPDLDPSGRARRCTTRRAQGGRGDRLRRAPAPSSSSRPGSERFFFLEMNTRLQVEHPVTEVVHGVDLVELQLAVAEGRSRPVSVSGRPYGHAIEVRLYAEDPASDWQPQSGLLTRFDVPGIADEFDLLSRAGLRVDSGFESRQRGLDALRRDARQGDRLGADRAARRPACWPTRSAGPGCTA